MRRPFAPANLLSNRVRICAYGACAALGIVAMSAHAEPHPMFDALQAQVQPMASDVDYYGRRIGDCSEFSIDDLDARSPDRNSDGSMWLGNVFFTWRNVTTTDGVCLYLEKPERFGLSKDQALTLLGARGMTLAAPFAQSTDPCTDATERIERRLVPFGPERMEEGVGYRAGLTRVDFGSDPAFAPLASIQRDFEADLVAQLKSLPFNPPRVEDTPTSPAQTLMVIDETPGPPSPPPGTNMLGVQFEAARFGTLASLRASWNFFGAAANGTAIEHRRYWLYDLSKRRVVTLDELFTRPDVMRRTIVEAADTQLKAAWRARAVNARTAPERAAEEARIDAAIARAVSPEAQSKWMVSIDGWMRPCEPMFKITLSETAAWPGFDWPEMFIGRNGAMANEIVPAYRDALSDAEADR